MSAHTPGPWAISDISPYTVDTHDHVRVVAQVCGVTVHEDAAANARLIAAAPELLDALRGLLDATEPTDTFCEWCHAHAPKREEPAGVVTVVGDIPHRTGCPRAAAESAIAKAEGRAS